MGQVYRPGPIEPVVLPGENLLLQSQNRLELYTADYIEPLPLSEQLSLDLLQAQGVGPLAPGATTPRISSQAQLDMNVGELGQFRFFVADDAQVTLYQPQASGRNLTRNQQVAFSPYTHLYDPDDALSEFYILEQGRVFFSATNPGTVTLQRIRIFPYGFRIVLAGKRGTASGSSQSLSPIQQFSTLQDAMDWGKKNQTKFTVVPVAAWPGRS